MCCTFGDLTDVQWWRELNLPARTIIGRDGRVVAEPPEGLTDTAGLEHYRQLAGATVHTARERVVAMLRESGDLVGDPRPVTRPVKFYEKGDRPLEIVSSRQWFIRTMDHRDALSARGRELEWHPDYMRVRFENWVQGLAGDWLISRQRFFGVPFPVWYPLDADGRPRYAEAILPPESALPIDPTSDTAPGYTEDQRGVPGGFAADPDVMDTWATSSLTPQIACGWEEDPALFAQTFPMDLRPQAHEIIRTWLFATVVRAELEHGVLPWTHAAIAGWILDPDRKKMSKSKGNTLSPESLLADHGSDAVRYWAAGGRPGVDTAIDPGQMKIGRRLATKLLNASKFVLSFPEPSARATVDERVDRDVLAQLASVVDTATAALEGYEYTAALEGCERFFWSFCDNYLELVKERAYGGQGDAAADSARLALRTALSVLLRLFAPVLPYVTEEVWSWWHPAAESVHAAAWPGDELAGYRDGRESFPLDQAISVLQTIRRAKSQAKQSMRAEVAWVSAAGRPGVLAQVRGAEADLRAAGRVAEFRYTERDAAPEAGAGDELEVTVQLA
jgi:valyl-tRNA synthetase